MKLFFDARWTRLDTHDGISRYGSELAGALARIHPITLIIHDKRQLKLLPKEVPYVVLNKPMSGAEVGIARKLNKLGAEVVFSPLQVMGSTGRKYKLILTQQDTIYYKHPEAAIFMSAAIKRIWWAYHKLHWPTRLMLNRADRIATVSKTSKQEIIDLHLTDRPIDVIYNAPTSITALPPAKQPKKNIIFMGSFMPYKNVELLMRAMELLPGYTLHLTGRVGLSEKRESELRSLLKNQKQVVFWRGASDKEYAKLLASATALVSASKAEGFGLPLLEGMQARVPIVCSDMQIFREVAGNAALYFDPDSPEEFAANIHKLLDKKLRDELIAEGQKQVKLFSWDKSARELLRVARQLHKTAAQK